MIRTLTVAEQTNGRIADKQGIFYHFLSFIFVVWKSYFERFFTSLFSVFGK